MTKYFILTLLFLASTIFSQTKTRLPNKTLKDSIFEKGDIIKIPKIIFDISSRIVPMTEDSLKPVLDFLKKYPNLKVEIGYFTDCRGNSEVSFKLSQHRAESIRDYFVKGKGIDSARIEYKGYGNSLPNINCKEISKIKIKEGLDEREKLYQINRRADLKVIDIK